MGKKSFRKNIVCNICGETVDIYTNVHSKNKFIDYKFYDKVCFTCYFVPKIVDQKYNKDGTLFEEIDLEYCCENLTEPKELFSNGSAETIREAKKSYESVLNLCNKIKKNKTKLVRPKADWRMVH